MGLLDPIPYIILLKAMPDYIIWSLLKMCYYNFSSYTT